MMFHLLVGRTLHEFQVAFRAIDRTDFLVSIAQTGEHIPYLLDSAMAVCIIKHRVGEVETGINHTSDNTLSSICLRQVCSLVDRNYVTALWQTVERDTLQFVGFDAHNAFVE